MQLEAQIERSKAGRNKTTKQTKLFEKPMANFFSNSMNPTNPSMQDFQQIPSRRNINKTTQRHNNEIV